jgi:ribose/xylose/arabinose/galactoside ABC-type transport system permease subunit
LRNLFAPLKAPCFFYSLLWMLLSLLVVLILFVLLVLCCGLCEGFSVTYTQGPPQAAWGHPFSDLFWI